ncbi:putative type VI secretion system effector [Eleftheria terrae]|uniref:putative type VI secretion system effector n=1 Tax=Eleftheria terrae TaxID=1597781 RepID=UPI00263B07A0|nr:putative type VI secretion system effector [Eleftheria terrae]WKB54999.1 hypothetical protein N7L95_11745 [Eleftheria terrae]
MTGGAGVVAGRRLVRLSGTVSGFRRTRARVRFVLTQLDSDRASAIAVAPEPEPETPPARRPWGHGVEEEADFVDFLLDGRAMSGWVWRSPFSDGDRVDVAAQWRGDHYEVFGIARPRDRAIALYPFCCRGSVSQMRAAWRWWALFGLAVTWGATAALCIAVCLLSSLASPASGFAATVLWVGATGASAISGLLALLAYSMALRWRPYARTAERVFTALGWRDPARVDLMSATLKKRTRADPAALGTHYFRY